METVDQIKTLVENLKKRVDETAELAAEARAEYAAALQILKPGKKIRAPRRKKGEAVPVAAHARKAPAAAPSEE